MLTVSIHETGSALFPGTGFPEELGGGAAVGTKVNLPLDPGTGERGWLPALELALPALAERFRPEVIVSQHGADAHAFDPLAHLIVTTTAMGAAARLVDSLAHRWARGRWLATGGGGYDVYRVVPRAWAHVWLAASHRDAPPATPPEWRARWADDAERLRPGPDARDVRRSAECRPAVSGAGRGRRRAGDPHRRRGRRRDPEGAAGPGLTAPDDASNMRSKCIAGSRIPAP